MRVCRSPWTANAQDRYSVSRPDRGTRSHRLLHMYHFGKLIESPNEILLEFEKNFVLLHLLKT